MLQWFIEYGPIVHSMTILKPLKDTTLLTPYEQYFIQTLHQEGQLISEQFAGEKTPFYTLPLTPPTHHSKKQVKSLPSYSTHSATLPLTVYLPTTTTGTYPSNTINFT